MLQRTAKSCGPDAPMLAFAEFKSAQPGLDKTYPLATVAKEPGHKSTKETVKTIACGNVG
jgi:hypothetical protein